ncbi:MAG: corrinoid-binding protein [Bacteroidetes bacterium HGW-Bacteroidetes-16]|jgi:methanogenic corrinoid protein MtbC1|nr:MAG: corrinoid-binding protein [Bacteroidetes bacterium HGW-Bacteroidetes-16]
MDTVNKREMIAHLINEGEKDSAVQLLLEWSTQTSFKEVIFNVIEPMLTELGQLWMRGNISLAHGYLSGKVAEEFYLMAAGDQEFNLSRIQHRGTVVLGNIEDDFHPLGRRLVNIYAQSAGWNIIDLGTDVTAERFIEKAIENKADIVAVSAMMFTTAKNIIKVRQELDKNSLSGKVMLAVGGAVFKLRPELVTEIGGDGTADTAIGASNLFETLLKKKMSDF